MPNVRRALALPILVAGLTVVSACGSSSSVGAKAKSAATAAPSTTASTTSSAGTVDSGGTTQLTGSFCDMLNQFTKVKDGIFAGTASTDPAVMLKSMKQGFANATAGLHQLDAKAPPAIKPDLDYTVQQFDSLNAQVQKLTSYSPEELSKITSNLDSPEASKHSQNLAKYAQTTCGVNPNAGTAS